jgi:hypothetical protein
MNIRIGPVPETHGKLVGAANVIEVAVAAHASHWSFAETPHL